MITARLLISLAAIVLGASFQFGYQTGVLNAPLEIIKNFINESTTKNGTSSLTKKDIDLISSVIVASFPTGGLLGAMFGGYFANRFGRKLTILLTALPTVCGSVLMFLAYNLHQYPLIIVGRFIIGISCGIYTCLAPMYLTEISPLKIKGAAGTINQFFIVIGVLVSQILGLNFILGTSTHWQYLLGVSVIPCILQVILLLFCPESPRYLLITRNDEPAAREALIFLRGTEDIEHEVQEMLREKESNVSGKTLPIKYLFLRRYLRLGLLISVGMQISQQLSGINAVIYYSNNIFMNAGFSSDNSSYATIGVGLTNLVATFISVVLVDRLGRKTLHLAGLSGMLLFAILLSLSMILKHVVATSVYFSMVFIFLYVASFGIGPGSIPWFIVAEMFTQEARGGAITVAVFVNWVCQIIMGLGYPQLLSYLNQYSFLPFVGLLSIFIIFTIKFVPETRGKTPEEIENYFKRKVDGREYDEAPLLTNAYLGPIMVDDYDYRI